MKLLAEDLLTPNTVTGLLSNLEESPLSQTTEVPPFSTVDKLHRRAHAGENA